MFKKIHWRAIPILVLLFVILCTTCDDMGEASFIPQADIVNAQEPIITVQPQVGLALKTTDSNITPLAVNAELQDDGVLSYQWLKYSDPADYEDDKGTAATGGAGAATGSFSPPVNAAGIFRYYARVTNTLASATGRKTASVKSEPVIVTVSDPNSAEYPGITELSGDGYYIAPAAPVKLIVSASVGDSGTLSYKWFSADEPAIENGTEIGSATSAEYTIASLSAGEYFYYVEVTNTNNGASGNKTATVVSPFTVNVVATNAVFTVDTATNYQFVRGFGGMYTPWDNAPQEYIKDFERMFSPNGLGLNMLRIMILPNNVNIEDTMSQITTGKDGDGKDQSNYYEFVKIVNKYGGYVLASPWTPPALWKTNNDIKAGGTLRTNRYRQFANYLAAFCKVMNDNGAPIYAVSMQNEPTFEANYDGCEYSMGEHKDWWEQVGHFTTTNPLNNTPQNIPGWGGGKVQPHVLTMTGESHNNVDPFHTGNGSALQDSTTRAYIDIVGRHVYGSGVNPITTTFNADGSAASGAQRWGKEVWMTEHNINSGAGSYSNDSTWNYVWKLMNDIDLTIRFNQENAFIWWTAKRFYSFIGDGTEGTTNGSILARGYGISHYAKFAKEMIRVAVSGSGQTGGSVAISGSNLNSTSFNIDGTDAKVTAYKSADGNTISLVMYTPTDPTGGGGHDMGTVRIKLPSGFIVGRATAMRSTSDPLKRGLTESVIICADKNSAIVTLPRSQMLSVRFVKAEN